MMTIALKAIAFHRKIAAIHPPLLNITIIKASIYLKARKLFVIL